MQVKASRKAVREVVLRACKRHTPRHTRTYPHKQGLIDRRHSVRGTRKQGKHVRCTIVIAIKRVKTAPSRGHVPVHEPQVPLGHLTTVGHATSTRYKKYGFAKSTHARVTTTPKEWGINSGQCSSNHRSSPCSAMRAIGPKQHKSHKARTRRQRAEQSLAASPHEYRTRPEGMVTTSATPCVAPQKDHWQHIQRAPQAIA